MTTTGRPPTQTSMVRLRKRETSLLGSNQFPWRGLLFVARRFKPDRAVEQHQLRGEETANLQATRNTAVTQMIL